MERKYNFAELGYQATFGKFAGQADNAVWFQQGGTVILAAVVSAPAEEFLGFFPLTIEYREQFAAAGRIPGGYFKREGKPTDQEVLTGRLIDRALRPLFPENYFDKVVLSITVYSIDKEHMPQVVALLAASLALAGSKIPFLSPVGACEVARINNEWVLHPTHEQSLISDARIMVAGDAGGINMVEGSMQETSESDFIKILMKAHETVKKQVLWQETVIADLAVSKEKVVEMFDWNLWYDHAKTILTDERVAELFTTDRIASKQKNKELETLFLTTYAAQAEELKIPTTFLSYIFDKVLKEEINELIFKLGTRIDKRAFSTVRPISVDVGLLPCNHGSAMFTRGRTQALASVTLGGGQDKMHIDGMMGDVSKTFMLHYNFPAFAVGEARPSRGVGRREVGHGHLAASAIEQVLPSQEKFPYIIRIVCDILESDGSSSMATVCASTMALMNAGVPIPEMVSGVAMGLLMNTEGAFQVLTDIAGIEDAFGLMDFKVAGTDKGILAIQMDIKHKGGLPWPVFEKALEQARQGRLHILGEMRKVMTTPNKELSALVPQIVSFKIAKEKIGAVIGSGGKVIRDIIEKTGTTIDIEDDGLVKIFGHPGEGLDKAVAWVKVLGGQIEAGARYPGVIKRLADFGIFVEIAPGQDGLVHISTIPRDQQVAFMKQCKEGDFVTVEVLDYDKVTDRIRLKIINEK